MPFFLVTFERSLEYTVFAESRAELDATLADMDHDEYRDWCGWHEEHSIIEVRHRMTKADCGVVCGDILAWSDYLKWKEDRAEENNEPQYPPDVLTLLLPGVK